MMKIRTAVKQSASKILLRFPLEIETQEKAQMDDDLGERRGRDDRDGRCRRQHAAGDEAEGNGGQ